VEQVHAFEPFSNHGGKSANLLFVDGHVEPCSLSDPQASAIMVLSGDPATRQPKLVELAQSETQPVWVRVAAINRVSERSVLEKLADGPAADRNIPAAAKARLLELGPG